MIDWLRTRGLWIALVLAAGTVWGQNYLVTANSANLVPVPMIPYLSRLLPVPGLTPGSLITLFGPDLTSIKGVVAADQYPLPLELAGTSVNFNGIPAPLLAIANVNGREQINLQVPYEVPVPAPDTICVALRAPEEVCSGELALRVNAKGIVGIYIGVVGLIGMHPEIFTVDGRTAIATHTATGRLVSAMDPAKPGEVVTIYATGLGPLKGVVVSGVPAPASPSIETMNKPIVTVSGLSAEVLFSGLAPGLVGVNQVDARVPVGTPSGDLAVVIHMSENTSEPASLRVDASPPETLSAPIK